MQLCRAGPTGEVKEAASGRVCVCAHTTSHHRPHTKKLGPPALSASYSSPPFGTTTHREVRPIGAHQAVDGGADQDADHGSFKRAGEGAQNHDEVERLVSLVCVCHSTEPGVALRQEEERKQFQFPRLDFDPAQSTNLAINRSTALSFRMTCTKHQNLTIFLRGNMNSDAPTCPTVVMSIAGFRPT